MGTSSTTIPVAGILGLTLVFLAVSWIQQANLVDFEALTQFVNGMGRQGLVIFALIYVPLSMLGISKVAMTVLAGALFSFAEAIIVTVIASTIAALLGFYLTRRYQDFIAAKFMKPKVNGDSNKLRRVIDKIEKNAEDRAFYSLAILRLSFVPLMMISYASGLVKCIRAREFFWAIFLTTIYINFVYIFVGASLTASTPYFMAAILVLLVFMQTPILLKKISCNSL